MASDHPGTVISISLSSPHCFPHSASMNSTYFKQLHPYKIMNSWKIKKKREEQKFPHILGIFLKVSSIVGHTAKKYCTPHPNLSQSHQTPPITLLVEASCPNCQTSHLSFSHSLFFQVLKDNVKSRREIDLHWRASGCKHIVNIRDVFENTYQGQKCLLVVMEW